MSEFVRPVEPSGEFSLHSESGWMRTVLAFIVLSVAVFGVLGFGWVQIQDRMNGIDAWREKGVREERDGYRVKCEKNTVTFEKMKEYLRQNKINVPPDYLIIESCIQPDSEKLNKPKE
jgi:hypothetical protein